MSLTSMLGLTVAVLLLAFPTLPHKLITGPYPITAWDSIIVQSNPIIVRERKGNSNAVPEKLSHILRARKRSFKDCPENDFKCLYGEDEDDGVNNTTSSGNNSMDRLPEAESLTLEEVATEKNHTKVAEKESSRKFYWDAMDRPNSDYPYDDRQGWVTLEPIPWSTSKISKWHPNKVESHHDNKPWGYGSTTQRPVHQFWVSGSNYQSHRPSSHWDDGPNDIITDNRPNDFPTGNINPYVHALGPGREPQNGYYGYAGSYQDFKQTHRFPENNPPRQPPKSHPYTYPSEGNGEWVLLSTTKGYALPHRWSGKAGFQKPNSRIFASRNIKPIDISRYHEEALGEKLSSSNENSSAGKSQEENQKVKTDEKRFASIPLRIVDPQPEKQYEQIVRRKVRLQVLPSLEPSSTSHGGLIEVDSSPQTVDEAQQEAEDQKIKKLEQLANVKKNKLQGYTLVPLDKTGDKGITDKGTAALAAVGAGMIPATVALLLPLALGRRRRSVPNYTEIEIRAPTKYS